jgi:hypothetical protein
MNPIAEICKTIPTLMHVNFKLTKNCILNVKREPCINARVQRWAGNMMTSAVKERTPEKVVSYLFAG